MNTCLKVESGVIEKVWIVKEDNATYKIVLSCNSDAYAVAIFKYVNE